MMKALIAFGVFLVVLAFVMAIGVVVVAISIDWEQQHLEHEYYQTEGAR